MNVVFLRISNPNYVASLKFLVIIQLQPQLTATQGESGDKEGSNLVLPLANPLTTALRSPPVELLLSPQYYPKPTAKRIFSVTR